MNNFEHAITPGQLRVQQLAIHFLKEKKIDPQKLSDECLEGKRIYGEFLARLAEDSLVCCDSLLAGRIVDSEVAILYVEWLGATKRGELDVNQTPVVLDFHRMLFTGSCFGGAMIQQDYERKVYQGCKKRSSVSARAVLTLANGGTVDSLTYNFIDFTYYANSRIIQIANGNHRLLACKLLGKNTLKNISLKSASIAIYDDLPNELLNSALLYFEQMQAVGSYKQNPSSSQVVNYESEWLELADTYQQSTSTDKRNELYLFTQYDLAKQAILMPSTKQLHNYVTVHTHLNFPPPQISRFRQLTQLFSKPSATNPLNQEHNAIKSRWEEWRTTL